MRSWFTDSASTYSAWPSLTLTDDEARVAIFFIKSFLNHSKSTCTCDEYPDGEKCATCMLRSVHERLCEYVNKFHGYEVV